MADSKLNVLLVGSGGREHALAWKLLQSPLIGKLYVAPGNAGTEDYNVPIRASDIDSLVSFAKEKKCFTIIGTEGPLALGLVDALERAGLRSFGPNQEEARLETSKSYAKQLMKSIRVPTAEFQIFNDYKSAFDYAKTRDGSIVIKVDGLASGKGVFVCSNLAEAEDALKKIFFERVFGDSGKSVVVEEKLTGYEVSLMTICDGRAAIPFGTATDHKRLLDGDRGPNTGGMGAVSPALVFDEKQMEQVMEEIVNPIVRNTGFNGFLYAGLMVTRDGPKVLEFNARLGDPETQSILPRLQSDLMGILERIDREGIRAVDENEVVWDSNHSCSVVMCSKGYPMSSAVGFRIHGLEYDHKAGDVLVFHSGTKRDNKGDLVTGGGRVLTVTSKGRDLREAANLAYNAVRLISWEGENHRSDIGRRVPF